jgi:hypothetical protein
LFLRDIFSKFIILGEMRPLGKAITENDINYTGRKAQCLGSLIFCAKILRFFRQREIDQRSWSEPLTCNGSQAQVKMAAR